MLFKIAAFVILALGNLPISNSQPFQVPVAGLQKRAGALPIAIYRNIGADKLNQMLIDSFLESNFSLVAVNKLADEKTIFQFAYPVDQNRKLGSVIFEFDVDGTVTKNKCMNCFLRSGKIKDELRIGQFPWMTQYDLSGRIYPDIDKAYASIKNKSLNDIDPQHGFDYKNVWNGEVKRPGYENSYVNIKLTDLKQELTRAFTESGFVFLRDSNSAPDAVDSVLAFSFPIESGKTEGVSYSIRLSSQFDADGLCYPCESQIQYNPYQSLPAAGLSAMASRLTLASRFESGLENAHDRIKASTERYLRPRTEFVRPEKTAPLGSPRPAVRPPVAT